MLATSCCSIGGGDVDTEYVITMDSPSSTLGRFKTAMLYGSNGAETAFKCLSKATQEKIPLWKFKYGFNLVDYDKNDKFTLLQILSDLQVREVVFPYKVRIFYRGAKGKYMEEDYLDEDEKGIRIIKDDRIVFTPFKSGIAKDLDVVKYEVRTIIAMTNSKRFEKEHKKTYSELVFMVREGKKEWKIDLLKTLMERGYMPGLDEMDEEEIGKRRKKKEGDGCTMVSGDVAMEERLGSLFPLWLLLALCWLGRQRKELLFG